MSAFLRGHDKKHTHRKRKRPHAAREAEDQKREECGEMKAKNFLQQIEHIENFIENKNQEREQWYMMATSTTAGTATETGVRVQSSGSKQRMADAINESVDIGAEIEQAIARALIKRQEIICCIEKLSAEDYNVLHKRYVGIVERDKTGKKKTRRMTFQEIADEAGKSYSLITTIHGRALKHVQDIIDGSEKL